MIFPYRQVTAKIIRPVIPIILKNRGKLALYSGLIDSGADYCIFNVQIAKELNISLSSKKHNLKGIAKEKVVGYSGKVELSINGSTYELGAIFVRMEEFGHGILGQKGFFDHFDVRLNYKYKIIEIKKLPEVN